MKKYIYTLNIIHVMVLHASKECGNSNAGLGLLVMFIGFIIAFYIAAVTPPTPEYVCLTVGFAGGGVILAYLIKGNDEGGGSEDSYDKYKKAAAYHHHNPPPKLKR